MTLSEHVYDGYSLGRTRGQAIARSALHRLARAAGMIDGIIDTVRTHADHVRRTNQETNP